VEEDEEKLSERLRCMMNSAFDDFLDRSGSNGESFRGKQVGLVWSKIDEWLDSLERQREPPALVIYTIRDVAQCLN